MSKSMFHCHDGSQEDEELESEMGLPPESPNEPHPLEKALKLLEERDAAAAAKILQQHTGTHSVSPDGHQ